MAKFGKELKILSRAEFISNHLNNRWHPTGRMDVRCELQLMYFPFDFQRCGIVLEPVIYTQDQLNLTLRPDRSPVTLSMYSENGLCSLHGHDLSSIFNISLSIRPLGSCENRRAPRDILGVRNHRLQSRRVCFISSAPNNVLQDVREMICHFYVINAEHFLSGTSSFPACCCQFFNC